VIHPLAPFTNRLRRRLAAAVAVAVTAFLPLAAPTTPMARASDGAVRTADATGGYWMVASDGGIFSFGSASFYGSTGNIKLNQPIVGIAATPTGKGYWMVATDGGIFSFGDAQFFGSTGNVKLNKPIVGMAATPSGKGYWLVASDGGIFAFGDAKFFGSTGNVKLNKPIVGMASSPSGNGYWFVASDGGIFAFGDAAFYGSTGNVKLAKPITAMAATPSGKGYWFTASDGGVFAFGDAKFHGAQPKADRTVAAMVPTVDGAGYWMASSAGELLFFGNAANLGGLTQKPNLPIVGMTAAPVVAVGPSGNNGGGGGTNNGGGGGGGTTNTTTPPTPTTQPPYTGPMRFSSTALVSWGTPDDPAKSRINDATTEQECLARKGVWESPGQCRVFPYAQKVADIVEIGNRVYIGGSFKDLHQNNDNKNPTMSGLPMDYVAELDTNGNAVPGSPFNAKVSFDGVVRALERSPDGRRLYVGGEFSRVNGEIRRRLVALDPATGEIDRTFNPPEPSHYVSSLAVHGSQVYVGGAFTAMGSTAMPGVAALNLDGRLKDGFVPPARYQGRLEGQTATPNENPPAEDLFGKVESLLVTRMGRYLLVGGTFMHFGYDHTADPNHLHAGLIALDPATGALTAWQPSQSSSDSKRRPAFGMANYNGNPRDVGINADELFFAATGGSGGRVIAWAAGGSKETPLWRGGVDGDAMAVAVTHDRVYLVGHFDHAVPDPNDPCLKYGPLPGGGNGVLCDKETPRRHLVAWDVRGEIVNGKNTGKAILDPSFTAQANTSEGPYAIHLGANRMYVGGNFTEVASTPVGTGGQSVKQPGFAAYPPLQ
jgi:hypothetical protein